MQNIMRKMVGIIDGKWTIGDKKGNLMIKVVTENKSVEYETPDALIDNIEKDFGEDYEEIKLKSLIINERDYKDILDLPTVGEVWGWYYGHKKYGFLGIKDDDEEMDLPSSIFELLEDLKDELTEKNKGR